MLAVLASCLRMCTQEFDLDDVVLTGGMLKPFAEEVVRLMDSYTEYSPSGKGLHILFKLNASLSEFGACRRNDKLGIEMYDCGRYFTITGKVYGEVKPIVERTEQARKIYNDYFSNHVIKIQIRAFYARLRGQEFMNLMFPLTMYCWRRCLIRSMAQKSGLCSEVILQVTQMMTAEPI